MFTVSNWFATRTVFRGIQMGLVLYEGCCALVETEWLSTDMEETHRYDLITTCDATSFARLLSGATCRRCVERVGDSENQAWRWRVQR